MNNELKSKQNNKERTTYLFRSNKSGSLDELPNPKFAHYTSKRQPFLIFYFTKSCVSKLYWNCDLKNLTHLFLPFVSILVVNLCF